MAAPERFTANNADIAEMCARIERFLAQEGFEPREAERLRLTAETLLRRVSERLGWGTRCTLSLERHPGFVRIRLRYAGGAFDPTLVGRESEGDAWSARLLAGLGLVPEWSWQRGMNTLSLRARRRENRALLLPLAALALGALLRFCCSAAGAAWPEAAERMVFLPLLHTFGNAVGAFLALKLFSSTACTICGTVETAASSRTGRLTTSRFLAVSLLLPLSGIFVLSRIFGIPGAGMGHASQLWALVPADPFSPFVTRNIGQIAFLSVVAGAALLSLGGRADRLRAWTEQCDVLFSAIAETLCRLTPLTFIAASACMPLHTLAQIWKPLVAFAALTLAAALVWLLVACLRLRTTPKVLCKRLLPPLAAAFCAGSGDAAFGKLMDNCENELGIAHPLVLAGLPIGGVLCVPVPALAFAASALFLAGVPSGDFLSLAGAALAGVLLASVLPSAPGALFLALTFALPELSGADAARAAVFDLCFTAWGAAVSAAFLQTELLLQGKRLDQLAQK